jgi:hypothetical protein
MGPVDRLPWLRALPIAMALCGCHDQEALARTERHGNTIVAAIESYRESQGTYPRALSDLVPTCLPEIPKPEWGLEKWSYESWEDGFTLGVYESARTGDGNAHYFMYVPGTGWMWGD